MREPYLWNCLDSLKRLYPDIHIIVAENGEPSTEKEKRIEKYSNTKYVIMPFDAGVCQARNRLVQMVKTDYFMVSDDDFGFTEKSKLNELIEFMNNHDDVDILGGRIIEGGIVRNYQANFEYLKEGELKFNVLEEKNFDTCKRTGLKYKKCDLVFNYFIARTEIRSKVQWEPKIKVAYEHSEFFLTCKENGINVYYTPDVFVDHKPKVEGFIDTNLYKKYRGRKNDKKEFFKKRDLYLVYDIAGRQDFYNREYINQIDFCITHFERKDCLENLMKSIVTYYPEANIYIADSSKEFNKKYYLDLYDKLYILGLRKKPIAFNLEHDCGLSYMRNFLCDNSLNEYKLILEDDFEFTEKTKIQKLWEFMDGDDSIDMIGGKIMVDGYEVQFHGDLEFLGETLKQKQLTKYEEINKVDMILNFFLLRSKNGNFHRWDDKLKINGEHNDYFIRAKKKGLNVFFTPKCEISHKQVSSEEYAEFRKRDEFLKLMLKKHNINKLINFNGVVFEIQNDTITKHR